MPKTIGRYMELYKGKVTRSLFNFKKPLPYGSGKNIVVTRREKYGINRQD
jgi:hypothetical protein